MPHVHRSVIVLATVVQSLASTFIHRAPKLRGVNEHHYDKLGLGDTANCADLANKGSYFSVMVTVGTTAVGQQPQSFDVVADTGSNAVIVTSCVCVDQGFCDPHDNCFRGTNRSATFVLPNMTDDSGRQGPAGVSLTYGSGTVKTIVGTDEVQVADKKVRMDRGLLLMVDRRQLRISGTFEGILGLGPKMLSGSTSWRPQPQSAAYNTKLFMEEASVSRYSLCFNDNGKPGAMRLDVSPAPQADALPAVGTHHWGLGLFGVSVGDQTSPSIFCDTMTGANQSTPCGMIPDSGTTQIMGPKDQIIALFESLCTRWSRCQSVHDPSKSPSKAVTFQQLLLDCASWMDNSTAGINEVPSIFLNVGGAGKKKLIELTAWAYITETLTPNYIHVIKHLWGVIPLDINVPTGQFKKVCIPSFGAHPQPYNTVKNGPVWIVGTPLFYQFVVSYDLGDSQTGPTIAFLSQSCATCNETSASFLSGENVVKQGKGRYARPMREMKSVPRVPNIDTSLPL